jgi:thiamine kinase-like enzyme
VLTVVADRGLGPVVIWADPDAGLLLTEYQEGHSWGEADLRNKKNLGRFGKLLQRLHQVSIDTQPVDLSRYAFRYAQQLATDEADRIAREANELADKWCTDGSRRVLCHNDPVAGNIIDTEQNDRLTLIDWEYAGLGEPCFDLAVFIRHHALSAADTSVFLDNYGVEVDEVRLDGCMALYDRLSVLWLMVICACTDAPPTVRVALEAAISRLNH